MLEHDEVERQLIETIEMIMQDARKNAQPYINRLLELRSMRTPTVYVSKDRLPIEITTIRTQVE
jgi:hypothetical protein